MQFGSLDQRTQFDKNIRPAHCNILLLEVKRWVHLCCNQDNHHKHLRSTQEKQEEELEEKGVS
jgi:phage FluMu protein Com